MSQNTFHRSKHVELQTLIERQVFRCIRENCPQGSSCKKIPTYSLYDGRNTQKLFFNVSEISLEKKFFNYPSNSSFANAKRGAILL